MTEAKLDMLRIELSTRPHIKLLENQSLRSWTSFQCTSIVKCLCMVQNRDDLAFLLHALSNAGFLWKTDFDVLGNGSNILVRDEGYTGCLIHLEGDFSNLEISEKTHTHLTFWSGAAVSNGRLLTFLREQELIGGGFLFGIPGNVGGGTVMNAGTPMGWYGDHVKEVEYFDVAEKTVKKMSVTPADFDYRVFLEAKNKLITRVNLCFARGPQGTLDEEIALSKVNRQRQPLQLPNFGSVFKNPLPEYAGRLIEACGLKGLKKGSAQISEKHANFIVNLGNARTSDAVYLMECIEKRVKEKFGIHMQREVVVLG